MCREVIGMAEYVGDKERNVVHKNEPASQRCVEADSIKPENMVFFATLSRAHEKGYRDCHHCIPQSTTPPT
jgi:hypothetical protein